MNTIDNLAQNPNRKKLAEAHRLELMPSFMHVVSFFIESLEDKRAIKILEKYLDGYSKIEIAEEFGLSRERIRQLINKAILILDHSSIEQTKEYKALQEDYEKELFINSSIKNRLEALQSTEAIIGKINLLETFLAHTQRSIDEYKNQTNANVPLPPIEDNPIFIKDIEISVRLQHALDYCKIETLSQLALTDPLVLLQIPQCGKKTVTEASELLSQYGLSFSKKWRTEEDVYPQKKDCVEPEKENGYSSMNSLLSMEESVERTVTQKELQEPEFDEKALRDRAIKRWEAHKEDRQRDGLPINHGKPWEPEEYTKLIGYYMNGKDIKYISSDMGRTIWSIYAKLKSLGFELPDREKGIPLSLPEERKFYDNPANVEARKKYYID